MAVAGRLDGAIALKKFIYNLWRDPANTASRIKSQGISNCIQVTPAIYEVLKNRYIFEERGIIHVQGKRDMTTYLFKGKRPPMEAEG
nr:adenylate/guanylate cyclase domain-containing protein [Planktothrix sp. FACHB-1355]